MYKTTIPAADNQNQEFLDYGFGQIGKIKSKIVQYGGGFFTQ
jgi:hypothetical protein